MRFLKATLLALRRYVGHRRHNHIHTPTSDIALPQRYNPFFFFFFVSCRAYFTVYLRPPVYRVVNTTHTRKCTNRKCTNYIKSWVCSLLRADKDKFVTYLWVCCHPYLSLIHTYDKKEKKKRRRKTRLSLSLYFTTLYIYALLGSLYKGQIS